MLSIDDAIGKELIPGTQALVWEPKQSFGEVTAIQTSNTGEAKRSVVFVVTLLLRNGLNHILTLFPNSKSGKRTI